MKALLIICIFIISCKTVQPPTNGVSITDIKLINSPDVVFTKKMNGTVMEISASTPLISASLKKKSDSLKALYIVVTKLKIFDKINNTSDLDKPISNATKTALQLKSDTIKQLKALVSATTNDIKLLKVAIAKKDTFFVKSENQVAGVIGSKLKPLDLSSLYNDIQLMKKSISDILARLPK